MATEELNVEESSSSHLNTSTTSTFNSRGSYFPALSIVSIFNENDIKDFASFLKNPPSTNDGIPSQPFPSSESEQQEWINDQQKKIQGVIPMLNICKLLNTLNNQMLKNPEKFCDYNVKSSEDNTEMSGYLDIEGINDDDEQIW